LAGRDFSGWDGEARTRSSRVMLGRIGSSTPDYKKKMPRCEGLSWVVVWRLVKPMSSPGRGGPWLLMVRTKGTLGDPSVLVIGGGFNQELDHGLPKGRSADIWWSRKGGPPNGCIGRRSGCFNWIVSRGREAGRFPAEVDHPNTFVGSVLKSVDCRCGLPFQDLGAEAERTSCTVPRRFTADRRGRILDDGSFAGAAVLSAG